MAKKKRKGGRNTADIVRDVMNRDRKHIFMTGCTTMPDPYTYGWNMMALEYPKKDREFIVARCSDLLTKIRPTWVAIIFVFHLDEGEEGIEYEELYFEAATAGEVQDLVTENSDRLWAESEADTKLSSGWCIVPWHTYEIENHIKT